MTSSSRRPASSRPVVKPAVTFTGCTTRGRSFHGESARAALTSAACFLPDGYDETSLVVRALASGEVRIYRSVQLALADDWWAQAAPVTLESATESSNPVWAYLASPPGAPRSFGLTLAECLRGIALWYPDPRQAQHDFVVSMRDGAMLDVQIPIVQDGQAIQTWILIERVARRADVVPQATLSVHDRALIEVALTSEALPHAMSAGLGMISLARAIGADLAADAFVTGIRPFRLPAAEYQRCVISLADRGLVAIRASGEPRLTAEGWTVLRSIVQPSGSTATDPASTLVADKT